MMTVRETAEIVTRQAAPVVLAGKVPGEQTPLAHADHAVRACYAALRMQESVRRYAEEVSRTVGVPIHIRVGVNSGDVVVHSIGSDLHITTRP